MVSIAPNGWVRLVIVSAAAWALAILGATVLEFQLKQTQVGDGFFTCWDPVIPPSPPAMRHWDRDCGLISRRWVAQGLFDDLPPWRRYLNVVRFVIILIGPYVVFGTLGWAAVWVARGFGSHARHIDPERQTSELVQDRKGQGSAIWLAQLPTRWARNSFVFSVGIVSIVALPDVWADKQWPAFYLQLLVFGLVFSIAVMAYLIAILARWRLRDLIEVGPSAALAKLTSNYVTGALLIAVSLLVLIRRVHYGFGYFIGFCGVWLIIGYLTAVMSRWGLRRAIKADRENTQPVEQAIEIF